MGNIGEFVAQARKRAKLTQGQLAEKTGLSIGYIGNLERGSVDRPKRPTLEALAAALDVSLNDLATEAGMSDPPSQRDIEAEMARLAALPTVQDRLDALSRLSPAVYDLVLAWSQELLVDAARHRQREDNRPVPEHHKRDQEGKQSNGRSDR